MTQAFAVSNDSSATTLRQQVVARVTALLNGRTGKVATAVPGLYLNCLRAPNAAQHVLQEPAFSLMLQGRKRLWVGQRCYEYDPDHGLLASLDVPAMAQVVEASAQAPYLGIRLDIDTALLASLLEELPPMAPGQPLRALTVLPLEDSMLEIVYRLLCVLDEPDARPVLAPAYQRELYFRLIQAGYLGWFGQIMGQGDTGARIARAIGLIRERLDAPLSIPELAAELHMSASSLHHHFKAVTKMTPLQYQKQLRLHQARQLLWQSDRDIGQVALTIGYESASQFSRDYRRFYGCSPRQDRNRLSVSAV